MRVRPYVLAMERLRASGGVPLAGDPGARAVYDWLRRLGRLEAMEMAVL